jgi:hypothetical protein
MGPRDYALWLLAREARAMLTRVDRVRPLVLKETMVPAAALAPDAQNAVEAFLFEGRRELRERILRYLEQLSARRRRPMSPAEAQRGFTLLKLRFNAILTHFDMFSEAVSQRSEAETGVWLAGLDVAARDAMALPGHLEPPPVVCFLARDPGGAIRRAQTRLPGGGENPVALIRLPRERMLSGGLASSLVHEVGHQGVALLHLMESLRPSLLELGARLGEADRRGWRTWVGWLSEILADVWAIGAVGISSTLGLMSLVSLPSAFVFRKSTTGPHPSPWLRVKLSAAVGNALYPHPQWPRLAAAWAACYPLDRLPPAQRADIERSERLIPRLVNELLAHRTPRLGGASLEAVLRRPSRAPGHLQRLCRDPRDWASALRRKSPSLAFAAIGQARADGQLEPELESELLARLLEHWALQSTLTRSRRLALVSTGRHCVLATPRAAALA